MRLCVKVYGSGALAARWRAFRLDRRAASALEYGLIASMVVVSITMAVDMLGHRLVRVFGAIATHL